MSKRVHFFLSHLFISLFIALCCLGLVFFIWYPTPLAKAVGVTHILLIMLAIDVIVGPLLGLLIYKENKNSLKMDLSIIIALQISALGYGMYSIEQGRPIWLAYNVDRFELVRKNEIIKTHIHQAKPQFQSPSWFKPSFVTVKFANDVKERNQNMFDEVIGGISLAQRPERYVNIEQAKIQIQQRSQNLNKLKYYNNEKIMLAILGKYPQATAFIPLKANAVDMTVLINKNTGEIIKIVDLRPWN